MKVKSIFIVFVLMMVLLTGCGTTKKGTDTGTTPSAAATPTGQASNNVTGTTNVTTTPDVVTTASIVDNETAFENAISAKGTWIIAILKDLSINKDLLLEGEFKNGKKDESGKDIIQRKIALYSQDEARNITARYTLTAPKLTVTSPNARIQSGTFKGDVYVSVDNFQLVDAKIDGNLYFTTDTAKSTFKMDDKSSVTGVQELKK